MNPEFLQEGIAVRNCMYPESIVIGTEDERSKEILTEVYSWAPPDLITYTGVTAAEAIKYAKNSFLATKITFANEWANFCQAIGVDVKEVMDAIGKDSRVGNQFLRNGPGYGGSCFPKDVNAIIHLGIEKQSPFQILETVVKMNHRQYLQLVHLAQKVVGNIDGKRVGVLGLSFKPNTDDTRESPALRLINYLDAHMCDVKAYCPQGMKMAREWLEANHISITYADSMEDCVADVDLVFVPTDWPEFRDIIPQITVPTFIGHRDLVDPASYPHVYTLGFPPRP
jgi:UDPglucose 6-dehydrogenase